MLPSILLYAGSISVFIGNELSVFIRLFSTPLRLLIATILRSGLFVLAVLYAKYQFFLNNGFIVAIVVLFNVSGAYLTSRAYELSSTCVKGKEKIKKNHGKVSEILKLWFKSCCLKLSFEKIF